ncbi:NAD(P)/FAD-dependent oxidoreductase [Flavobacterium oreochromis]|uniref:FAD-dependent oxidoreductase n=2 Tax=Flavobacterium TaxID=237 RepID=A0A246GCV4_9FLAO|nr:FAD-dependent oxidoreductase [Flavobacterium oreochromis]OWP74905.1 FAD-dependent oxidoreductase [Flavobacterium oreochromis]OWP79154.1 FAD-dependent oxidoreductase [Flavobacterium oreochromis]POR18012.1 FAD-dependent oxidoreductase [Flavobacterium columnare]QYS86734.1 FAD-dependent oxidoreductase [Flavobacterium oreochromis]
MIDYLIVGSGIAGISFAEIAKSNGKSIRVLEDFSTNSSRIAGGLYNPVILKRFSEVWKAKEQIDSSIPFLNALQVKLKTNFVFPIPVFRKFASIEEQNNWFQACDKPNLSPFLSPKIIHKKYESITSDFGFGEVLSTGYLEISSLIDAYINYLKAEDSFINERFDYKSIEFFEEYLVYKGMSYKNIIFAEGFGLVNNPFFNDLPLDGTKGELLIIKAPNLKLDVVLKSSIFILPIGNSLFKVGATYNWEDKTDTPTEEGKNELINNLKELIDCDFEIVQHFAGVRPTVKDRRPLLGTHPVYKRLHILNGLGTRGVMLGPWLAHNLFNFLEKGVELDRNISTERFRKKKLLS